MSRKAELKVIFSKTPCKGPHTSVCVFFLVPAVGCAVDHIKTHTYNDSDVNYIYFNFLVAMVFFAKAMNMDRIGFATSSCFLSLS